MRTDLMQKLALAILDSAHDRLEYPHR